MDKHGIPIPTTRALKRFRVSWDSPCSPPLTPPAPSALCQFRLTCFAMSHRSDLFVLTSSTSFRMAENLLRVLDSFIQNLPEEELRKLRDAMEHSVHVADDILFSFSAAAFDTLSISEGRYRILLFCKPSSSSTVSSILSQESAGTSGTFGQEGTTGVTVSIH